MDTDSDTDTSTDTNLTVWVKVTQKKSEPLNLDKWHVLDAFIVFLSLLLTETELLGRKSN